MIEYIQIFFTWLGILSGLLIILLLLMLASIKLLIAVKDLLNILLDNIHKFISGYKFYE